MVHLCPSQLMMILGRNIQERINAAYSIAEVITPETFVLLNSVRYSLVRYPLDHKIH